MKPIGLPEIGPDRGLVAARGMQKLPHILGFTPLFALLTSFPEDAIIWESSIGV